MLKTIESRREVARELQTAMQGQVVWPDGITNDSAALIAVCENTEDVQAAIRVAREHGLQASVREVSGGWYMGDVPRADLVIDLSNMRQVEVDANSKTASVAGGATAGDVMAAAAPHGLAAVTAPAGSSPMVSLTLSGGYAPLSTLHGLALDSLAAVELVLADGRCVVANSTQNPDLFWALRGSGYNFGVVTSMQIHLHPLREVMAGLILFPWTQAESVLRRYAEAVRSAPNKLAVDAGMLCEPDGSPVLFLAPAWTGERSLGEDIMVQLWGLGAPIFAKTGLMTCQEMLGIFDDRIADTCRYSLESCRVRSLTPDVITALVEAGNSKTSNFSAILLHHFRGAASRVPIEKTAFGLREEHFLVEAIAGWKPTLEENHNTHRQWQRNLTQTLDRVASRSGDACLVTFEAGRLSNLGDGSKAAKLQALKQRFASEDSCLSAKPQL